ncbi:MAG: TetR/AcrR family transcriptional regulator [Burkholderiaceae bacterium]|nr:TetR/AcrR family transcriptional regulator [Burkholderiaceae bacterium]
MSLSDFCPIGQAVNTVRAKHARRKEARPGELLDAALDLFVAKGFAATRAEEVAAKAGVSKGTLFLYFKSKEDLFEAVVRENITNQITQGMAELEAFEGTTAELLRFAMFAWWNRVGNTKASGITKLVMSEASNFPTMAAFYQDNVVKPAHQLIRAILQRGLDRGEFRALNMDYAVYSVIAPLIFLTMWKHSIGPCCMDMPLDPEDFISSQADIVIHGILAPSHTPPPPRPSPT